MNNNLVKDTAKRFAQKVREMRRAQQDYFAAPHGSDVKARALALAKKLEREVDAIAQAFDRTIDVL
jgi:ClpP class serine protease